MIVKRKIVNTPNDLYYISGRDDLDGTMLKPSIPSPELVLKAETDLKIPRVSVFPTIGHALSARKVKEGDIVSVYKIYGVYPDNIITPTTSQSPLADVLDEKWLLSGPQLKKIGEVEVGPEKETKTLSIGRRGTKYKVSFFDWTDLRPQWEQKKYPIR